MKKLLLSVILLILLSPLSSAYIVETLEVHVWHDGNVTIDERIYPEDYEIKIKVPVFGENVRDIIVLSNDGRALPYTIQGNMILIHVYNATKVRVIYTASGLVSNMGSLWELKLHLNRCPAKIILPKDAKIVGLSDIPIEVTNNTLIIGPGNVTVYYTYPEIIRKEGSIFSKRLIVILLLLVGMAIGILSRFRKKSSTQKLPYSEDKLAKLAKQYNLNDDEVRAIKYLLEVGGKSSQAELRKALDLPKTTVWRMVRRLEQMGLIKVYKVGRENWVELKIDMHKFT
ncbi:transcriptional regulator [Thermococcus chitonophagus]|uniref:Transcriptional regulator n=1 Tax=Thermococcus chitonophagus TaxID=54262 RepID=A0A160VSY3_9EURY|nr:winged helix-turn-helix transcriptional regulator [Thermococcus chitonophagus]ASJ16521.1 transcriptional regulator [Thermococcus chitonophagus]CUX77576.1 hypothetical protein CHITON_0797 [Thermococcus chitonophagus]